MKIENGEIIEFDNKEYICVTRIESNGINYLYLISNFKPLEVMFAKEIIDGEDINLEIINNEFEKKHILELLENMENKIN